MKYPTRMAVGEQQRSAAAYSFKVILIGGSRVGSPPKDASQEASFFVLDYAMPEMDGPATLEAIRSIEALTLIQSLFILTFWRLLL